VPSLPLTRDLKPQHNGEERSVTAPCRPVALSGDGAASLLLFESVRSCLWGSVVLQQVPILSNCVTQREFLTAERQQTYLPVRQYNNTHQLLSSCHFTLESAIVTSHVAS
jgi:hypothetical protein